MQLIDAARLELCSFMDESQLPPYAILSHTWGADEVILDQFEDVHSTAEHGSASVKNSQGFGRSPRHASKL